MDMSDINIRSATISDLGALTTLALKLWPDHNQKDLNQEILACLENPHAYISLVKTSNNVIGFAICQLRSDYVEGTSSSPVGYLEGIFIENKFRRLGLGSKLVSMCENWSHESGCTEFASDCELHNEVSLKFHIKNNFTESNRIICFTKHL